MGAYMILYFVSLVLSLVFYFLFRKYKKKIYENLGIFFIPLMIFFLVFALYTKDPIEELLTAIPAFWQFVTVALGGAFAIWKVYLNPLKDKVYGLDRELGEVKTTVNRVEIEMRDGFNQLEKNIESLKE